MRGFLNRGDILNLAEIYSEFDTEAPPLLPTAENGLQLVEDLEGVLGLGYPQYFVLDGFELSEMLSAFPYFTGSSSCFYTDVDGDGIRDMIVPIGGDLTGDGVTDFAYVLDMDGNGIPDADPEGVFYPVGSEDYKRIISTRTQGGIIIMSSDGSMTVYDPAGTLTYETYNEAYALWLKDNSALDKKFDNYSVSEGLLFLLFVLVAVAVCKFAFGKRGLY